MTKEELAAVLEGADALASFVDTHGSSAYDALKECVDIFLADDSQERKQIAWSGTGIPPVGTECEIEWNENKWLECRITATTDLNVIIFAVWDDEEKMVSRRAKLKFRSIRTEAEKRREDDEKELVQLLEMNDVLPRTNPNYPESVADAEKQILDAGFSRGGSDD